MKSGIYKIVNTVNGKFYVGSTNSFSRRWGEHRKRMRTGASTCTRLQAAWNKYGEESFEFSILETVSCIGDLVEREQFWIDLLCPAYNVAPSAGSQAGFTHSSETRARLSACAKEITPEQRAKMVAGIRGMSPEAKAAQRARQSASHMGNKYSLGFYPSEETRKKRSLALKVRYISPEHRANISKATLGKPKPRKPKEVEV